MHTFTTWQLLAYTFGIIVWVHVGGKILEWVCDNIEARHKEAP